MNKIINKRAVFSIEALILFLVLFVLFSWVFVLVSKTAVINKGKQNEALAQVHAESIIRQLTNTPCETVVIEIQNGTWNYPNVPSVLSLGLGGLPNETIITEEAFLKVNVTVRWQNPDGQYKEKEIQYDVRACGSLKS